MISWTSLGGEELVVDSSSEEDDVYLGTVDGRENPVERPPYYYENNFDSNVPRTNNNLSQLEELETQKRLYNLRRRRAIIPGNAVSRTPLSLKILAAMQSYDFAEKKWSPNKRASISKLPTREITIENNGRHDKVTVYALSDPYDDLRKFLFEDCYRSDPVAKRCINLEADVVLGTRTMSVIDIDEEFTAEQLANGVKQQRISQVLDDKQIEALQTEVGFIDRSCKLRMNMKAAMVQAGIGGRSVLEKVLDEEGIPQDIKILNWKKLGTVFVDPQTWKLVAIEYADRPENEPLLPEEIIHFEVDDFHISPDSLLHGTSKMEPIAATSEINRLLDEADLKEIAKTRWSPTGAAKFPLDTDPETIRTYMQDLIPGSLNGTDLDVTFEQFDLEADIKALFELRMENDRRITRSFGTPNPVVGFENVTNRATIETVLRFYFDTEVRDLRTWLQDTMEVQWYEPILKILAPDLFKEEEPLVQMNTLSQQTRNQLAATRFPVLERRQTQRRNRKPKVKVKLEFEDVSIDSLKDKAAALLQLHTAGLITTRELLKRLGMPHLVEEIEQMQEQKKIEEEKLRQEELGLAKQSIEVGRQRTMQVRQNKAVKQNKTASIADQILFQYQHQNALSEMTSRHKQDEHLAKMAVLNRKNRIAETIEQRINSELAKS
jgi:hypothetical protein